MMALFLDPSRLRFRFASQRKMVNIVRSVLPAEYGMAVLGFQEQTSDQAYINVSLGTEQEGMVTTWHDVWI
jgi:hypothetical protein